MTAIIEEDFEGPANGVELSTGNSTIGAVYGAGSAQASTTRYVDQTDDGEPGWVKSLHVDCTSAYRQMLWAVTTRNSSFVSLYFWLTALPTGTSGTILEIRDPGDTATIAQINVTTSGTIRMRNGTVATGSAQSVSTGQWYRLDWSVTSVSAKQTAHLYTGANLHSTDTADAVSLGVNQNTAAGQHGEVWLGVISATTFEYYADRFRVDDASLPAPVATAPPSTGLPVFEDFNDGTLGDAIDETNTTCAYVDTAGTASFQVSDTEVIEGYSGHLVTTAGRYSIRFDPSSSRTDGYVSLYLMLKAYPSANSYIAEHRDAGTPATIVAELGITTAGAVRIRNASAVTIATSTEVLALDTWYRIDWSVTSVNHLIDIYTGNSLHSTSRNAAWWTSGSVSATTPSMQNVLVGSSVSSTVDMYFDYVQLDDTALPAPYVPPPSSRTDHPVRVYNGSSWLPSASGESYALKVYEAGSGSYTPRFAGDTAPGFVRLGSDWGAGWCESTMAAGPWRTDRGSSYSGRYESGTGSTGKKCGLRRHFRTGGQSGSSLGNWTTAAGICETEIADGRIPWISLKPDWASAAAGGYDAAFLAFCNALKVLSGPVFVTLQHEPENDGRASDAPLWRAMQQRFRDYGITPSGATNITFMPVYMDYTFDPYNNNSLWHSPPGSSSTGNQFNINIWWNTAVGTISNTTMKNWDVESPFDMIGIDHYLTVSQTNGVAPAAASDVKWNNWRQWAVSKGLDVSLGEFANHDFTSNGVTELQGWYDIITGYTSSPGRIIAVCWFENQGGLGNSSFHTDTTLVWNGSAWVDSGTDDRLLVRWRQLIADSRSLTMAETGDSGAVGGWVRHPVEVPV